MYKRHKIIQHICFWSVLAAALTAESWMDLICRAVL